MNRDFFSFGFSFFMHASILGVILYVCPALDLQPKPILIDFSLLSAGGPQIEKQAAVSKPSPPPPQTVEKKVAAFKQPRAPKIPKPIEPLKPFKRVVLKKTPKPVIVEKKAVVPEPPVENHFIEPESQPIASSPSSQTIEPEIISPSQDQSGAPAARKVSSIGGRIKGNGNGSTGKSSKETLEAQYVKAHFLYIKEIVEKKIRYPMIARKMGWQGKVVVCFIVEKNGEVKDLQIVESSGYAQLDKNAIETIKQAVPLPSPPVRVKLVLPVTYKIS